MSYRFSPNEHFCVIFLSAFADSEGKLSSPKGSHLVHMALMMHSWVVPSQMFAQKLLTLYPQLSHSLIVWSLWSFAWSHMTRFFNLLRKQAWHCFTLNMLKQIWYRSLLMWFHVLDAVLLIRTVPQTRGTWDRLRSATLLGEWGHVVRENWFCCSVCGK